MVFVRGPHNRKIHVSFYYGGPGQQLGIDPSVMTSHLRAPTDLAVHSGPLSQQGRKEGRKDPIERPCKRRRIEPWAIGHANNDCDGPDGPTQRSVGNSTRPPESERVRERERERHGCDARHLQTAADVDEVRQRRKGNVGEGERKRERQKSTKKRKEERKEERKEGRSGRQR